MLWYKEDMHPICLRVGVWVSGILDQMPSMGRYIAMFRGSAISYSGNVIRQDVVQNMVGPAGFEPAAIGL